MAASIEFHPDARAEFDEAFDWYAERSIQAAIGFATEVDVAIQLIATAPQRHAKTYAGCQLCRLKRYPYCVIYHVDGEDVYIVAITHAKRDPGYWRRRRE